MKQIVIVASLLLLSSFVCFAQNTPGSGVIYPVSSPAGSSCTGNATIQVFAGIIYTCQGGTLQPINTGGGGLGTVTNFSSGGLSPLFTTLVGNPTTTPALSFSLTSATANTVFAAPNGVSGSGSYRALVGADIPAVDLSLTTGANGGVKNQLPYSSLSGVPAVYYQTVQANGTAATQRAILNLIAGTNATVLCADNSGSGRTDCTISVTAGGGTVNPGTAGQLAYYASNGSAISGLSTLLAGQFPALTGDVTNSAGSLATTVSKVNNGLIPNSANLIGTNGSGQFIANNTSYLTGNQTITISGDASGTGATSIPITLSATAVTPGTYGDSTHCPTFTVDAKGRLTAASQSTTCPGTGGSVDATGVTYTPTGTNSGQVTQQVHNGNSTYITEWKNGAGNLPVCGDLTTDNSAAITNAAAHAHVLIMPSNCLLAIDNVALPNQTTIQCQGNSSNSTGFVHLAGATTHSMFTTSGNFEVSIRGCTIDGNGVSATQPLISIGTNSSSVNIDGNMFRQASAPATLVRDVQVFQSSVNVTNNTVGDNPSGTFAFVDFGTSTTNRVYIHGNRGSGIKDNDIVVERSGSPGFCNFLGDNNSFNSTTDSSHGTGPNGNGLLDYQCWGGEIAHNHFDGTELSGIRMGQNSALSDVHDNEIWNAHEAAMYCSEEGGFGNHCHGNHIYLSTFGINSTNQSSRALGLPDEIDNNYFYGMQYYAVHAEGATVHDNKAWNSALCYQLGAGSTTGGNVFYGNTCGIITTDGSGSPSSYNSGTLATATNIEVDPGTSGSYLERLDGNYAGNFTGGQNGFVGTTYQIPSPIVGSDLGVSITGITNAASAVASYSGTDSHIAVGNRACFFAIFGMTQVNGQCPAITAVGTGTFTVAMDTTSYGIYSAPTNGIYSNAQILWNNTTGGPITAIGGTYQIVNMGLPFSMFSGMANGSQVWVSDGQCSGGSVSGSGSGVWATKTNGVFACGLGGSGTVNTGTSGQLAYYSANGNAVSGENTLAAGQFPALTGDVTNSAGSLSTTVGKVNGATVPASATFLATNSSSQIVSTSLPNASGATPGIMRGDGTTINCAGGVCTATSAGTGNVVGPATSTVGNIALFNNTSGTLLSDSGKVAPTGAIVGTTDTQTLTNKSIDAGEITSGLIPLSRGGTNTATPNLVAGTGVTITGTWPNQTVTATGLSNPMSAVGDSITGGTGGTPTRVAGNISTTPAIYTETGTGTAANQPAWVKNTSILYAENVLQHGVKGDCVSGTATTETAAIQAVLNTYSVVYFPPAPGGCYAINSALTMKSNQRIIGAGFGDNGIKQLSTTADAIQAKATLSGSRDIVIENLNITDGVRSTRTAGHGIDIDGTGDTAIFYLRNNQIYGFKNGENLVAPINSVVFQDRSNSALTNSFQVTGLSTSTDFVGTYGDAPGNDCYEIGNLQYSTWSGTACDAATRDGYHFYFESGGRPKGITLNSPGIETAGRYGIYTEGQSFTINQPAISGIATGSGHACIAINQAMQIYVQGGQCGGGDYAINVLANPTFLPDSYQGTNRVQDFYASGQAVGLYNDTSGYLNWSQSRRNFAGSVPVTQLHEVTTPMALASALTITGQLNYPYQVLTYKGGGRYNTSSNETGTTLTFTLNACTTSACSSGRTILATWTTGTVGSSGNPYANTWNTDAACQVQTTGASGTVVCHGSTRTALTSGGSVVTYDDGNTAAITLDTTQQYWIVMMVQKSSILDTSITQDVNSVEFKLF